jgi:hypothetical protein
MNYLFAPSTMANNTVRRGDKRNVEGQSLYYTLILNHPWQLPVNYRDQVLDLMAEKDPYLITRSQPDLNWEFDNWVEEYFPPNRQKALQSIQNYQIFNSSFIEQNSQLYQSHLPRSNKRTHTRSQIRQVEFVHHDKRT